MLASKEVKALSIVEGMWGAGGDTAVSGQKQEQIDVICKTRVRCAQSTVQVFVSDTRMIQVDEQA